MNRTDLQKYGTLLILTLSHSLSLAADLPVERMLTNSTGRTMKVIILEKDDANIKVRRKTDGKEFFIDLGTISLEDRTFLKDYSTKEKEFKFSDFPPTEEEPEVRNWKLKSGQTVIGKVNSVNEQQEVVFVKPPQGNTHIIPMASLTEDDLDQAYLQHAGATLNPSSLREFTWKGKPLKAKLMHIGRQSIFLKPLKGPLLRDVNPDDLSQADLEFIRNWYSQAKK